MLIWFALIIPILTAIGLLIWFKHKTVWWEFMLPFLVSLICVSVAKWGTETLQTSDTEFWGGWATHAEYFERWNERVSCRHTKYCSRTRRDSQGRTSTVREACGNEHSYDVDDHPAKWVLYDSNEESQSISSQEFERFTKLWRDRRFVDLHRSYHSVDGDKYVTKWNPSEDQTMIPITTKHTYENRVQAASSVLSFREVENAAELGLFEYPDLRGFDQRAVLGNGGEHMAQADLLLRFWNAKLGRSKQVHMFILVFPAGSTLETGLNQESYWKGGNKNEFTLALGIDQFNKVTWAYVISWTDVERLKVDVREFALEQGTLDLVALIKYMVPEVQKRFERKPFADFSYLTVEPSGWAVVLSFLLTLLVNGGLSMWIIKNKHQELSWNRDDDASSGSSWSRTGW